MKLKNNKGYVAIDMAVAIIGIIVFSGLIISLMYSNFLENAKTKKEAIAVIYLTELMENVGIATYEQVPLDKEKEKNLELYQEKIENLKPADLKKSSSSNNKDVYRIDIKIVNIGQDGEEINIEQVEETNDIIKKITATISYTVGNKKYSNTLQRIKIKE